MTIRIIPITDEAQLTEALRADWNRLPMPSPMQSFEWTVLWWRTYGTPSAHRLSILTVYDEDRLVAVAPWYLSRDMLHSNCLRFLGDGNVCSDHATLLLAPGYEAAASAAIAQWLCKSAGSHWQTIHFESIDDGNAVIRQLVKELNHFGCEAFSRQTTGCWSLELPADWDQYLAGLSKNHRTRCRRRQRKYFDSGAAEVTMRSTADVHLGWQQLARLNQARREHLGDRSAFLDETFHQFHLSVLNDLIPRDQAQFRELRIEGEVKAIEYVLRNEESLFCYQSGMMMDESGDGYGNLMILAMIHGAIESGIKRIDFLRGDEAYKQRWGAVRTGCTNYHLAAPSLTGKAKISYLRSRDVVRRLRRAAKMISTRVFS